MRADRSPAEDRVSTGLSSPIAPSRLAIAERGVLGIAAIFIIGSLFFPPIRTTAQTFGEILVVLARFTGCGALLLASLLGLGLIARRLSGRRISTALLPLPGFMIMVAFGLALWVGGPLMHVFVSLALLLTMIGLLVCGRTQPLSGELDPGEIRVALFCLAVFVMVCGRAMFFMGPSGELYGATISRTFAVGDRSDSRISFVVVQIVTNHITPYSPPAAALFAPWNFSDRGPLAGIAAAPIVVASGGHPSLPAPDAPWQPFDLEGFAAYRLAMFGFAISILFVIFGFVRAAAGEKQAFWAVAIAAGSPFFIHETLFTWPKILACVFALAGAYLALRPRTSIAAGMTTGIGYLCHPSAVFALLCQFGALAVVRRNREGLRVAAGLVIGLMLLIGFWRLSNGANYRQGDFLIYIFQDSGYGPGTINWIQERLVSLANTLVPGWLLVYPHDHWINEYTGREVSLAAHIDFLYWDTLPFGIGLFSLIHFWRTAQDAVRRFFAAFLAIIVLPFLVYWIYWGASDSGLMRESFQWWFFALIIFVAINGEARVEARLFAIRWWTVGRIVELGWLLFGSAMVDNKRIVSAAFPFTDLLGILIALFGLCLLFWFTASLQYRSAGSDATVNTSMRKPIEAR